MAEQIQIRIKAKKPEYYEAAKEFGGIEAYKKWIQDKEPRYLQEVAFKTKFPVLSYEITDKKSIEMPLFTMKGIKIMVPLSEISLITLYGKGEEIHVYISKSILDKRIGQENKKGTKYLNAYINEYAEYVFVAPNIWLSKEHFETVKENVGSTFKIDFTHMELLSRSGLLSTSTDLEKNL